VVSTETVPHLETTLTSVENNFNLTNSNLTEITYIQEKTSPILSNYFEVEKVNMNIELTTFKIETNSSKAESENSLFNIFIVLLLISMIIIIIFAILFQVYGRKRYYLKIQLSQLSKMFMFYAQSSINISI
jgi:ATP-dependent Zn protease